MMSQIKFDGYADFHAGSRFIKSLVVWLKPLDKPDQPTTYEFLKRRLVHVSLAELRCLFTLFFPEVVMPALRPATGIKPHEV